MLQTQIDIKIVDSRDDNKISFLYIENCKVPILKTKLNNICYIMKLVGNICHIELDVSECEKANK